MIIQEMFSVVFPKLRRWNMKLNKLIFVISFAVLAGCAHNNSKDSTAADASHKQKEAVAKPGSKFSKIKLGLTQIQVREMIGKPNKENTHSSGKQFIPFYFGEDRSQVTEYFYKNEGILRFGSMSLIEIKVNPKATGLE